MNEQDIAAQLIRAVIKERRKLPIRIDCTDPITNRSYYVVVTDKRNTELFEWEIRATIGGGGGRCGCCLGTGKAPV